MASVSVSLKQSVEKRLSRYKNQANKKDKRIDLQSRSDTIDHLLKKAGF